MVTGSFAGVPKSYRVLLVEALPLPWFPKVNIGRGAANDGIKCVSN